MEKTKRESGVWRQSVGRTMLFESRADKRIDPKIDSGMPRVFIDSAFDVNLQNFPIKVEFFA